MTLYVTYQHLGYLILTNQNWGTKMLSFLISLYTWTKCLLSICIHIDNKQGLANGDVRRNS